MRDKLILYFEKMYYTVWSKILTEEIHIVEFSSKISSSRCLYVRLIQSVKILLIKIFNLPNYFALYNCS